MLFVKNRKCTCLFFILALFVFSISALEFNRSVYKEVTVHGNKVFKRVKLYKITEYDSYGNLTHYKDSDDYEYWSEYDSDGNQIHYKYNDGEEG